MAFTNRQLLRISEAVKRYHDAQDAAGNAISRANLIMATAAVRKAAIQPYLEAQRTSAQATQVALPAQRSAQDTELATLVSEITDILAQL